MSFRFNPVRLTLHPRSTPFQKREMAKASRKASPKQKTSPLPGSPASPSPLAAQSRFGFSYSGRRKAEEPKESPGRPSAVGADEAVVPTKQFTVSQEAEDTESVHPPLSRESSAGVTTISAAEQGADSPVTTELGSNIPTSPSGEAGTSHEVEPFEPENLLHLPSGDVHPTAKAIAPRGTIVNKAPSVDPMVLPTPGSIAQLAAAAAAKRAARRTNDSLEPHGQGSGSTDRPQRTQVIDSPLNSPSRTNATNLATSQTDDSPEHLQTREEQVSGAPASPRRTQVTDSPPNSPSRIASLLATKLFGWNAPKETEDVVEEVDF
jgi:hypothetical protein